MSLSAFQLHQDMLARTTIWFHSLYHPWNTQSMHACNGIYLQTLPTPIAYGCLHPFWGSVNHNRHHKALKGLNWHQKVGASGSFSASMSAKPYSTKCWNSWIQVETHNLWAPSLPKSKRGQDCTYCFHGFNATCILRGPCQYPTMPYCSYNVHISVGNSDKMMITLVCFQIAEIHII